MRLVALLALAALVACSKPAPIATVTPTAVPTVAATASPVPSSSASPTATPTAPSGYPLFSILSVGAFTLYGNSYEGGVNFVPFWTLDTSCQGDSSRTCYEVWGAWIPPTTGVYQAWLQIAGLPLMTNGMQQVTALIPGTPYWAAFTDVTFGTTCPAGAQASFWVTWTPKNGAQVNSNVYSAACPQGAP